MLKIKINTRNAAFGNNPRDRALECARILREIADKMNRGAVTREIARDINGNIVGEFTLNNR